MITSWDIYWITRLGSLSVFFGVIGGFTVVLLTCFFSWLGPLIISEASFDNEKYWKIYKQSMFYGIITGIIFILISCFIPTTKEFAAIYLIPKIANNEQMQKLPDNVAILLNTKMRQWIDDTMQVDKEKGK